MTDGLAFQCQCGVVRGRLTPAPVSACIRFVCHCDDCQVSAVALGHPDMLDARGGTDAALVDSSRLRIDQGLQSLATLRVARIASRPVLRWHCAACRTPLFNTYDVAQRAFLSFLTANSDPAACDRMLGPSSGHIWTKFARGGAEGLPQASLPAIVWRLLTRQVSARLTGDYRNTPLFYARTGRPIAAPRIMAPEERAAAQAQIGAATGFQHGHA